MDKHFFFELIANPVLYDEQSPYKLMTQKLNDIDINYFEFDMPLGKTVNKEIEIGLKHRILSDFVAYGNELLDSKAKGIETQIVANVKEAVGQYADRGEALRDLDEAFAYMHQFTRKNLCFVPIPKYDNAELRKLYAAAKKITLVERVTGSNDEDVIEYYHALIEHCVWACRMLMRRRASQFLMQMVDVLSHEFNLYSPFVTTIIDEPLVDPETGLPTSLSPLVDSMTEKLCDRNTALEMLRFIVAEGFCIEKNKERILH